MDTYQKFPPLPEIKPIVHAYLELVQDESHWRNYVEGEHNRLECAQGEDVLNGGKESRVSRATEGTGVDSEGAGGDGVQAEALGPFQRVNVVLAIRSLGKHLGHLQASVVHELHHQPHLSRGENRGEC